MNETTDIIQGNCMQRAFHLQHFGNFAGQYVPIFFGEPILVHGIIYHKQTGWHIHCWVEDEMFCWDFDNSGQLTCILKPNYYEWADVKTGEGEIMRYTKDESRIRATETGLYYFSNLPCDK